MRKRLLSTILALCMTLSLLPATAAAAGGQPVSSSNKNKQDYTTYGSTVKSYLYENETGGLTRVEHINNQVVIEDYDSSFRYLSGQTLTPELPIWGGFFAGEQFNFLIFGQNNMGESDSVEVIRVVKYDKNWNRLGQASLKGANTQCPFNAGSLRCDEYGGYLYIRTCHTMYTYKDGLNHQANLTLSIKQSDMSITDSYYGIWNEDYGYVSHSFNQFIIVDEAGKIVTLDHGDANSTRGVAFMKYYADAGSGKFTGQQYGKWCSFGNMQPFAGASGNNTTGGSIGGLAETSDCYIMAYNYDGTGGNGDRYVFYHFMDKASGKSYSTQITQAPGATTPVLAPTGLNGGYMLWNGKSGRNVNDTLYYLQYGANGQPGQVRTATGSLSDCQPIYYNGKAVWYVTDSSAPTFYQLDSSGATKIPAGGGDVQTAYTVTFTGGAGAVGTAPTQAETAEGGTFTLPANPFTRTGYTFAGWNDGARTYQAGAVYTMPGKNVTFTAQWTEEEAVVYTVTFTGGAGAAGAAPTQADTAEGGTFTLPANPFTRTGYTFAGWNDGARTYQAGAVYTMPGKNVTFTAQWTEEAPAPSDKVIISQINGNITVGSDETYITKDGTLFVYGDKIDGGPYKAFAYVDAAEFYLLQEDGTLWQLDTWDHANSRRKLTDNVSQICDGGLILKKDGTVWSHADPKTGAWEQDSYFVMSGVKQIAGNLYGCNMALKEDGSLWTWGENDSEIWLGREYPRESWSAPAKILDDVAYATELMALKKDGTVWSWGSNYFGAVGNGSASDVSAPIKIMDNAAAIWASCSGYGQVEKYALTKDGDLYSWGFNGGGQLGYKGGNQIRKINQGVPGADLEVYYQNVPRKTDLTGIVDIKGGLYQKADGAVSRLYDGSMVLQSAKISDGVVLNTTPPDTHKHTYTAKVTAPTCTAQGYTTHTCSQCGDSYVGAYTAALGHSYGEWRTVTAPTATTSGLKERFCVRCNNRQTQSIPATGGTTTPSGNDDSSSSGPSYSISAPSRVPGGTVKLSPTRASEGSRVTITAKPNAGYELGMLTVTDSRGKELALTDKGDGKYTFTMPKGEVDVKAEFARKETTPSAAAFSDVKSGDWFYSAVQYVQQRGLMNGVSSGRFDPNSNLSRAQLAQILYNASGNPAAGANRFSDVPAGQWYSNAVSWAAQEGIVSGYGADKFGPNDNITREQLAVMLWHYAGQPDAGNASLNFTDAGQISGYAAQAMRWAVENGIMNGYGEDRLAPNGLATRAQVASMLMRYMER